MSIEPNRRIPLLAAAALVLGTALGGCVVAPPPGPPGYAAPAVVAPAGVVYIAPTYARPGPGYVWAYHPHYGWGWHHPQYGWHQGWRPA
jgi:hypothetical protein